MRLLLSARLTRILEIMRTGLAPGKGKPPACTRRTSYELGMPPTAGMQQFPPGSRLPSCTAGFFSSGGLFIGRPASASSRLPERC